MNLKELVAEREKLLERKSIQIVEIDQEISKIETDIGKVIDTPISQARLTQGKDTGVVNMEIDGVEIKHTLPKNVKWDQASLKATFLKIQTANDDPLIYMDVKYSVPEKKYTSFPDDIKNVFNAARTVGVGKPKVEFKVKEV